MSGVVIIVYLSYWWMGKDNDSPDDHLANQVSLSFENLVHKMYGKMFSVCLSATWRADTHLDGYGIISWIDIIFGQDNNGMPFSYCPMPSGDRYFNLIS